MGTLKYPNQSGTVYVYDVVSEWDPIKKQSRSKRRVVGKVDPATGETVPTSGRRGRPKKNIGAPGSNNDQSDIEKKKVEDAYNRLKLDYDKLQQQNAILRNENKKMKTLILRFCSEASGYCKEEN